MTISRKSASWLALLVCLMGCAQDDAGYRDSVHAERAPAEQSGIVDSVLPMSVLLERFRVHLQEPQHMTSGVPTRDGLVDRVVQALESNDTMAFEPLAISVEEFAWLYYPTTMTAQPPYELPPGVAWLQIQQRNRDGVLRALREYGGAELDYRGYRCDPEPSLEGGNRMWRNCVVTIGRGGQAPRPIRLFGTIIERDGRFAVVSYSNDF